MLHGLDVMTGYFVDVSHWASCAPRVAEVAPAEFSPKTSALAEVGVRVLCAAEVALAEFSPKNFSDR